MLAFYLKSSEIFLMNASSGKTRFQSFYFYFRKVIFFVGISTFRWKKYASFITVDKRMIIFYSAFGIIQHFFLVWSQIISSFWKKMLFRKVNKNSKGVFSFLFVWKVKRLVYRNDYKILKFLDHVSLQTIYFKTKIS